MNKPDTATKHGGQFAVTPEQILRLKKKVKQCTQVGASPGDHEFFKTVNDLARENRWRYRKGKMKKHNFKPVSAQTVRKIRLTHFETCEKPQQKSTRRIVASSGIRNATSLVSVGHAVLHTKNADGTFTPVPASYVFNMDAVTMVLSNTAAKGERCVVPTDTQRQLRSSGRDVSTAGVDSVKYLRVPFYCTTHAGGGLVLPTFVLKNFAKDHVKETKVYRLPGLNSTGSSD